MAPRRPISRISRAARHLDALALQLPPDFADPIDLEILIEHPPDIGLKADIALCARRQFGRISLARRMQTHS
jgi:hypothetical protein